VGAGAAKVGAGAAIV
jgi:hypothetical protein